MNVESGAVAVHLGPRDDRVAWSSVLERAGELVLQAPDVTSWIETWHLEVSPIWHVEQSGGIPLVHHQDPEGRWAPTWQPWPGEEARLEVSRPEAVPGRSLTVDQNRLEVRPGRRGSAHTLALSLRSSMGGQHSIFLPEGAELQEAFIDGRTQPLRLDAGRLTFPVRPGSQVWKVTWRSPEPVKPFYRTPRLDLGSPSVNAATRVVLNSDRWVLFAGGPCLGPAVLFWGVLLVVALVSAGLGRVPFAPLRTWEWFLLGVGLTQAPLAGEACSSWGGSWRWGPGGGCRSRSGRSRSTPRRWGS